MIVIILKAPNISLTTTDTRDLDRDPDHGFLKIKVIKEIRSGNDLFHTHDENFNSYSYKNINYSAKHGNHSQNNFYEKMKYGSNRRVEKDNIRGSDNT